VVKIDPATMTTVLTWTGSPDNQANCKKVTGDGTHIYAAHACSWNFGPLSKIDPLTMTTVSTWFPESDQYNTYDVAFDGTYLYAALSMTPAKVSKIDPATLTTVSVWTGASGQNLARAIIPYKDNIYLGGISISVAMISMPGLIYLQHASINSVSSHRQQVQRLSVQFLID
jgi:DNA-binding beta-propeller fold protein YncE